MSGKRIKIDTNKIYHAKASGDFKIIEEAGRNKQGILLVKVKFIDTGYETVCQYSNAIRGLVRDKSIKRTWSNNITAKDPIDTDKIYHSNNYGDFKILREAPRSINTKYRLVAIQFINTGSITMCQYSDAIRGKVRDKSVSIKRNDTIEIDTNKIYHAKASGDFKIIEEVGRQGTHLLVKVKFIDTGYETVCQYSAAIRGKVRDKSLPRKCNNKGS